MTIRLYAAVLERSFFKTSGVILFNKKYPVIFKAVYDKIKDEKFKRKTKIPGYKIPCHTHNVNYRDIHNQLMNTKFSDNPEEDKLIKKLIGVVNYGLLEKGGSTDSKSFAFRHLDEALEHQAEYGGRINKTTQMVVNEEGRAKEGQKCYILNLKDKDELTNGFRYVKELILQMHSLSMYEAYEKLMENKIRVYSVKTDAFVIDTSSVDKAKELLGFHNDVGGWRVSKSNQDFILPTVEYNIIENEKLDIPVVKCKELRVKDEYGTDNIIDEYITVDNPIIIRGEVPGTGKSYLCQRMIDRGFRAIFVCSANKLLQSFEGEAITVNKFFRISFGTVKLDEFDFSELDVIVFDEVFFSNMNVYWKMKKIVDKNKKHKRTIGTGDALQLKPIQELTNTQDYHVYANEIIDSIFPNKINLKICKRLSNEEDRIKICNIRDDIFVNKLSFTKIIEKHFSYTTDIKESKYNIAFLKNTCKNVSHEIRKQENRQYEYEISERLICRVYTKVGNTVFNVKFEYEIVAVCDDFLMLKDIKSGKVQGLNKDKARSSFIFASCFTCHSAQGSSIDGDITMFDYNHFLVTNHREFLWTAITRARDLSRVKF